MVESINSCTLVARSSLMGPPPWDPQSTPDQNPRALTAAGPAPSIAREPKPEDSAMDYADYQHLTFDRRPSGVVLITINRPEVMNATNARLHWELTQVWLTIDADPAARVALVTGAGRAFSAGGDISLVEEMTTNREAVARTLREAADLVYNMINLDKPVISAINGVAVGAGLVVALLADVSIISETARFTDGHTRLGVAAGDHAAIIWPLLCGMAKAKYYLLTSDFIDGREAERIGLVSRCVPADKVMETALGAAQRAEEGGRLGDAEQLYAAAIAKTQGFDEKDRRIEQSLTALGDLHGAQGRYADAARFYDRALTALEKALPAGDPGLVPGLN